MNLTQTETVSTVKFTGVQEVWRLTSLWRQKIKSHSKPEDKRLQNCLDLKSQDLATKPEDWKYELLIGKIWLTVKTVPQLCDTSTVYI